MKHIFYINNHTTFYTSLGVIEHEKIINDDVWFFTSRNYSNIYFEDKYQFLDFSEISSLLSPLKLLNLLKIKKIIIQIDQSINGVLGNDEFVAYIPHLSALEIQSIVTNPKCLVYNYIEEGLAAYNEQNLTNHFVKISRIKRFLLFFINLLLPKRILIGHPVYGESVLKQGSKPMYYLLKNNFQNLTKNVISITWPIHRVDFSVFDDSIFLILSPLVEYGLAHEHTFFLSINTLISNLPKFSGSVYVKFHPKQSFLVKTRIEKMLLNYGARYHIIPDTVPMEQLFLQQKKGLVLGIDSSLLFYAKITNINLIVRSALKILCDIDSLYKQKIENNKQIFLLLERTIEL